MMLVLTDTVSGVEREGRQAEADGDVRALAPR
jgi:hypothetical protein